MNIGTAAAYASHTHMKNSSGYDPRAANLFDRAYRNPRVNRFKNGWGGTFSRCSIWRM
jgi:hypothetical protein